MAFRRGQCGASTHRFGYLRIGRASASERSARCPATSNFPSNVEAASPGTERRRSLYRPTPPKSFPMPAANIIPPVDRQADDRADDGLDIPEFLKISAERRKQAWLEFDARHPSKPIPTFGREMREVEHAYRASIE